MEVYGKVHELKQIERYTFVRNDWVIRRGGRFCRSWGRVVGGKSGVMMVCVGMLILEFRGRPLFYPSSTMDIGCGTHCKKSCKECIGFSGREITNNEELEEVMPHLTYDFQARARA